MYHIFKLMNIRNRAYVIDLKGNKIFFGTEYKCKKFIEYMKEGDEDVSEETGSGSRASGIREACVQMGE